MTEPEIVLEGRTEHRLPPAKEGRSEKQLERHGKGPADRAHRSAFTTLRWQIVGLEAYC